ncbi:MAG: hypothetical protein JNK15_21360 [Planctomycetes bacterium]|nr:hypothetical protein [Planctomycetota bacterium]
MNLNHVLATGSVLLLAAAPSAQARAPFNIPAPLPGLPVVQPPVDHPALAGQPLIGDNARRNGGGGAAGPGAAPCPMGPSGPEPDPDTQGKKLEGKQLKQAVRGVAKSLVWLDSLAEAKAKSAATGKPILWLQALGDLEGFA